MSTRNANAIKESYATLAPTINNPTRQSHSPLTAGDVEHDQKVKKNKTAAPMSCCEPSRSIASPTSSVAARGKAGRQAEATETRPVVVSRSAFRPSTTRGKHEQELEDFRGLEIHGPARSHRRSTLAPEGLTPNTNVAAGATVQPTARCSGIALASAGRAARRNGEQHGDGDRQPDDLPIQERRS